MIETDGRVVKRSPPAKSSTRETDTRGQVVMARLYIYRSQKLVKKCSDALDQKDVAKSDVMLDSLCDLVLPCSASLFGLLAKIKV